MSVNEDTMVFVDCHDGVANEREPSVEVLEENSSDENARGSEDVSDEREDIVLVTKFPNILANYNSAYYYFFI